MTPTRVLDLAIRPALTLLPSSMRSPDAEALLLAIALQESQLTHRRQIGGPARSLWQFELNGVLGVLRHRSTRAHALALCDALSVASEPPGTVHVAMEYQDVLAAGLARLLLWTYPAALPGPNQPNDGWAQYIGCWRPGKPHRHTWDAHYARAWRTVAP